MARKGFSDKGLSIGRGQRLDHGARLAAVGSDAKHMAGSDAGETNAADYQGSGDADAGGDGGTRAEAVRRPHRNAR